MNQLKVIAENFMTLFRQHEEFLAEKEATAALMELAGGSEEIYLSLRNELSNMVRVMLENDLREDSAVAKSNASEEPPENVVDSVVESDNV